MYVQVEKEEINNRSGLGISLVDEIQGESSGGQSFSARTRAVLLSHAANAEQEQCRAGKLLTLHVHMMNTHNTVLDLVNIHKIFLLLSSLIENRQ